MRISKRHSKEAMETEPVADPAETSARPRLESRSHLPYLLDMLHLTKILSKVDAANPQASAELLPLVYEELRKLASRRMATERSDHTLQATALVHEAYVRLVDAANQGDWDSRAHFFSAAAVAMRRILIDHARSKARLKRGGNARRVDLREFPATAVSMASEQLLELDDALEKLEREDVSVAELVRLRVYAGLSVADAAETLRISKTKAYELWDYALAWFAVELKS